MKENWKSNIFLLCGCILFKIMFVYFSKSIQVLPMGHISHFRKAGLQNFGGGDNNRQEGRLQIFKAYGAQLHNC